MAAELMNRLSVLIQSNKEALALLGSLTVAYLFLKLTCTVWKGFKEFFFARALGLGVNFKSYGSWAVVTGSTDGIGLAYAEGLAKCGLNIILISRSADKLTKVAKDIESKYTVHTKAIAVDFTDVDGIYSRIARELEGLDIGVLVNNVGVSYEFPKYLVEVDDKEMRNVLIVNCFAATFMTKIVLPGMVDRKKGIIINISSLSGARAVPFLSVYSATKAYIDTFSECINEEYKSKGILVQNVSPGFVATKLSKIRSSSLLIPNPTSFVSSALSTVGVVRATYGCAAHGLMGFVTTRLPDWLYHKTTRSVLLGARAKGLKKQRDKKE